MWRKVQEAVFEGYLLSLCELLDADLLHVALLVKVVELDVSGELQCA